ncbi:alpha/beta hydrolase family protein [Thalassospira marina]|uniref:alpha/beta hydrolase family protein n=1 Tax=Thalassospira marina TaxID=2048283 RepID=UPI00157F868E|nr:alpha/beta fold hydrolase [Thalassospira marina]
MKHVTSAFLIAMSLWAAGVLPAPAQTPAPKPAADTTPEKHDYAGFDRFDVYAAHRSRPMEASIWYPAGTHIYFAPAGRSMLWEPVTAYIGAAVKPGKHPLVLLSHGSGGNMVTMSWLASQLALKGAIVLGVNHPGTTSGDSSPRRTVYLGQRAADISATLDQVLANPEFASFIDPDNISVVGFSLGGTTVLNLAGMQFDRQKMRDYCGRFGDKTQDCAFFRKGGVDFDHLPDDFAAKSPDHRIKRFVAIEPGLTDAVNDASLTDVKDDVLFIRLGRENGWRATDFGPTGSNLLSKLSHASLAVFAPAYHLTFLPECKPGAAETLKKMEDDPLCSDPAGTDRKAVHDGMVNAIGTFLKL